MSTPKATLEHMCSRPFPIRTYEPAHGNNLHTATEECNTRTMARNVYGNVRFADGLRKRVKNKKTGPAEAQEFAIQRHGRHPASRGGWSACQNTASRSQPQPAAARQPGSSITVASRQPAVSQPAEVPSQPTAHQLPSSRQSP